MISIALLSNLLGSLLFLVLTILLLVNWRGQLVGGLLILASLLSTLWFSSIAWNATSGGIPLMWIRILEILRDASWLSFLYLVLRQRPASSLTMRFRIILPLAILFLSLSVLFTIVFRYQVDIYLAGLDKFSIDYLGCLLMALLGLLLIEQIYRSTLPSARWAVKFLCVGVGGIFVYDFFLYSEALLFNRINADIWFVRGAINAMCVPFIAVAITRNPQWNMELFVSRHVVYQSTVTMMAGIYLMLMAIAGYYVREYGGMWGSALQILFIFGAIMLLVTLIISEQVRTRLKVFLAEHFYRNKYDYRQEWLHLTRLLAESRDDKKYFNTIVTAIADTMKCPGGGLWLAKGNNIFRKVESFGLYEALDDGVVLTPGMTDFILSYRPVINISEYRRDPDKYQNISMPSQWVSSKDIWLFVALVNNDSIVGFVLLTTPHADVSFNAEDVDLLATMGFQIASYITLLNVSEKLAEARQFEVFNRLSAFVVHDIKNLMAQLSLITDNATKYRNEPEFIDDVFVTIANSVAKMKKLLANLQKGELLSTGSKQEFTIAELLDELIKMRGIEKPVPRVVGTCRDIVLYQDRDKLLSVLEHLVQNAQEATPSDGEVYINVSCNVDELNIQVTDTGSGMDAEFIDNMLFKPFVTTKGNAGMGIGVYESREVIGAMGGRFEVESKPGEGTTMSISLPLEENANAESNVNKMEQTQHG